MKPQRWLAPLTPLCAGAVRAKNAAYDRGVLRQHKLRAPVVSIGNLSTGGTGKTPFVIALAKLLVDRGIPVDVLSRGYGRSSDAVEKVDPTASSKADRYGDEPLLIARSVAAPVYVGRSRYAAGLLAEQDAGSARPIHLLDDGFQHRQLARDLDIVLLHRRDFHSALLPAGPLREPLSSLRRAQVIVLRQEDSEYKSQIRQYATAIWHVRRQLIVEGATGLAVAFCGIAYPQEFVDGLRNLGVEVAATIAFPDHHRFSEADLAQLGDQLRRTGAVRLLTTEKDYTRLSSAALAKLQRYAPVEICRLETAIVEADAAVSLIRRL